MVKFMVTKSGLPRSVPLTRRVEQMLFRLKNDRIARYVGEGLAGQVEKVFVEMGGKPFLNKQAAAAEHWRHAQAHGRDLAQQNRRERRASTMTVG